MNFYKSNVHLGKNTPVLFLNGAFCNSLIWGENYLDYFLENGFDCYTHDYINTPSTSFDDYVYQIIECIDAIGEPPVIVAHSMGAAVIQKLYSQYKIEFPAWVLIAPTPPREYFKTALSIRLFNYSLYCNFVEMQLQGAQAIKPRNIKYALFSSSFNVEKAKDYMPMICPMPDSVITSAIFLNIDDVDLQVNFPVLLQAASNDVLVSGRCMDITKKTYNQKVTQYNCGHGIMLDRQWQSAACDAVEFINQCIEVKLTDVA